MADSEKSSAMMVDDEDLEDGEIEDDDEPEVVEVKPEPPKPVERESTQSKKKSSPESRHSKKASSSSSRKEKSNNPDEDDFMSNIEAAIAEGLKKSGIEPPMPNVKKQADAEPELERRSNRNDKKRRKRERAKERRDQKREGSSRKRSKQNDSDGFYMVGGSPDQSNSDSDNDTSYSSYDSDDYRRSTYEERRNKRREKYGSNRDRDRERDRERGRKDKKSRDTEKEVCLRFSEFGHCPDDDCTRAHEVRQPKKMELCKFWLMECCAKKDKCSYMHGDFPCKYYYLGLKCVNKDCKFMHAKPLSDNLKSILLKHLDTAPKEILGDFPRFGRENATKMIAQTHVKLCQEFNVPLPESEKDKSSSKIPSLLEMNIKPPDFKNDKKSNKNNSRWLQNEKKSPQRDSPQRSATSSSEPAGPGDVVLADLIGILSDKQIESMALIGVRTVNHINNLTVAQLNDLGLSLATIGEIQATAMNMNMDKKVIQEEEEVVEPEKKIEDVDLREPPQLAQNLDVDMRVIPTADEPESAKSPDTIMSPNQSDADDVYKKPDTPPQRPSSSANVMMSPPSGLDYSQYLKDSNLNNDDEVEDEPGLRIDETYCTSDYEQEDRKDSQSEDDQPMQDGSTPKFEIPLLPPSFDTSHFLKSTTVVTKIDISSSVSQLMEKETPKPVEITSPARDPRSRDPRMSMKASPAAAKKIPEIASPTYRDPRQKPETSPRASIYEIESPSEDEDLIKIDRDKDMRLPPFLRDPENGDVDLRFPFTPMSNYVPATEIDASFGIHVFDKYEVQVIDIPKPDYAEIRRSFRQSENTQDPRLKKLCGHLEEPETTPKTGLANILPLDPRKRKQQETLKDETSTTPKKLQITSILQNSKHYNELSSSQKMVVNEVLAELSKQLKQFHADTSPSKIFDSSFITQRPKLQQILIGLGVFVNASGEFEEIKEMPIVTMPNIHQLPPMIPNLPPPSLISLNQPPPNFLAGNMRPGLLGMAPNLSQFGNFESQDINNFPPMNQGMPFNEPFNNRDFGSNQNNRRDQRQPNSSFRNNSNRNNNYSRHRRN